MGVNERIAWLAFQTDTQEPTVSSVVVEDTGAPSRGGCGALFLIVLISA